MFYVNEHILKRVINEYRGSEQKETVYLDDGKKYMIKKPDPTRELLKRDKISYINNTYSEYIGCHIAQMLGFQTQDTILGKYDTKTRNGENKTKIVCLCADVRQPGETMHEFDTVSLSTDVNKDTITFDVVEDIIQHIHDMLDLSNQQTDAIRDFYYDLFVFDAFVGNTDRHNGNIALLTNADDTFSRISPVYDCGSSLLPLIDDDTIKKGNMNNLALTITSVIHEKDGERIQYKNYLETVSNPNVDAAVKRILPRINMNKIKDFIRRTECLSEERKEFYCNVLQIRYERILLPTLQRIFPAPEIEISEDVDLYQTYKKYIKPVAELPLFEKSNIRIEDKDLCFIRVSKRYAISIINGECAALLPIRSNNNEIRKALGVFQSLGLNKINEEMTFDTDYSEDYSEGYDDYDR
jgi:hypothetical protein